jgi:hypothetical protein
MALGPGAMQMLRKGPTMGPSATPGGAAPPTGGGLPATPGETPGSMLMNAIAQKVGEAKKANADFATGNISQLKRVAAAMVIHLSQSHPQAARHLNKAWSALDQAEKALKDAMGDEASGGASPPLGFSGAGITGAGGQPGMGPGPGMGPAGM